MPEKETMARVRRDKRRGKAETTQAGEFVREEMHHIRAGKHGARSPQQAIAIGLSKARRAGVNLPPPRGGKAKTRRSAELAYAEGQHGGHHKRSRKRSRAVRGALRREGHSAASPQALRRQVHKAAKRRGSAKRSAAAKTAARTRARDG